MSDIPKIEIDLDALESLRKNYGEHPVDPESDKWMRYTEDEPSFEDEDEEVKSEPVYEQPAPKRKGRLPYLRNPDGTYKLDENGKPIKDASRSSQTAKVVSRSTSSTPRSNSSIGLPAAPLSKREERQVAERLANIMQGVTGVVSVANDVFAMTDDEAKAISEPLASYLIRMEPTNKVARQILDEYDLVAVATGSAAYGVRVYRDLKAERVAKNVTPNQQPIVGRSSSPSTNDDGRSAGRIEDASEVRESYQIRTPVIPSDGPQV
jgi:hypothetical protein